MSLLDPALALAMIADPTDDQARLVYADWLQAQGDPLGDIIALEHAGHAEEARALFATHHHTLVGAFAENDLVWERGFIKRATLRCASPEECAASLDGLLRLRGAVVLEELRLPIHPTRELLERVASGVPHLRHLFTWLSNDFDPLLPRLVRLRLWIDRVVDGPLDALLSVRHLPSLRELEMIGESAARLALPQPLLERLLASPLVQQLERLAITQGLLPAPAARSLVDGAHHLAHLDALSFHNTAVARDPDILTTFAGRLRDWQYAE